MRRLLPTALLVLALAAPAWALDKQEAEVKVKEAAVVVESFMTSPDKGAPSWLLQKAKGVVIVPGMIKAGLVVAGTFGQGMVVIKKADGSWSPPSFITMLGGDFGFQIGAQAVDLLLVAVSDKGLKGILRNKVKFGADASVTAGPVGRSTAASLTDASLTADVYSYSRSAGAFAGVSLGGAGMETNQEGNQAYYGHALSADDILHAGKATPPESARQLMHTLAKYSK